MLKILDIFAGAGGFSLGFSLARNFEVIGAIEIDKWASETFEVNHPKAKVLQGDIQQYSEKHLLDYFADSAPDIILGGPPCQGFSICTKNAGDPKDPRNSLFTEFIRLGKIFHPQIMIMENVPNLVKAKTHKKELVIDIILKELERLGYYVYYEILSATDYSIPQIRKRLFVIASQEELENPFPQPTHTIDNATGSLFDGYLQKCPTLWEAISDLPELESGEGAEILEYSTSPQHEYQHQMREGSEKVFNHKAMNHTKRMIERFKSMSWGESVSDVPDHLKPLQRNGNGEISGKVYDQNNRRMHPDKPCHTIAASFYANFVHPFKHRNFTPREGARIQSFPDYYVFKGKPTVVSHKLLQREERFDEKYLCQYNQIGNAVPPLLAKALAENLFKQINKEKIVHERTRR